MNNKSKSKSNPIFIGIVIMCLLFSAISAYYFLRPTPVVRDEPNKTLPAAATPLGEPIIEEKLVEPVNCVGAWEESPCPATCTDYTTQDIYKISVQPNTTGRACDFTHNETRTKTCPGTKAGCVFPQYNANTIYSINTSSDNYVNFCKSMAADGWCVNPDMASTCREECA